MRVAGALVVVAAASCGGRPAAVERPVANAREVEIIRPTADSSRRAKARPHIEVSPYEPDFHEELRWPLAAMSHPVLEPRFPIARELAIDVDWQTLCARGVQNRTSATQKELIEYLHGWCDVQKRDVDAACAHLVPLLAATTRGLAAAVRHDLANILVDTGDADRAEHWLATYRINDIEVLDLLAASFVEVGAPEDAVAINRRVTGIDVHAADAPRCQRLLRRIVLGVEADPVGDVELKELATRPKSPDATCVRLWSKVACWRDRLACDSYYAAEHVDRHTRHLFDAYNRWPEMARWDEWLRYADETRIALPARGAAELVVTALETGVAARGNCPSYIASSVRHTIDIVRKFPHEPYEQRLQALEQACPQQNPVPPAVPPAVPAPVQPAAARP